MNKRMVNMADLEKAKDKMIMGAESHSMVMNEKEKKMTAYHEAGHAIVGRLFLIMIQFIKSVLFLADVLWGDDVFTGTRSIQCQQAKIGKHDFQFVRWSYC